MTTLEKQFAQTVAEHKSTIYTVCYMCHYFFGSSLYFQKYFLSLQQNCNITN